jgi:hypothetical protein
VPHVGQKPAPQMPSFNSAAPAPKIAAKKKSTRLKIQRTLYPPDGRRYQRLGSGLYVYNDELELLNWVHENCNRRDISQGDKRDALAQFMTEYMYTNDIGKVVDFRFYMKIFFHEKTRRAPTSIPLPLQNDAEGRKLFAWFMKFVSGYNRDYNLGIEFGQKPDGKPRTDPDDFRQ